MYTYILINIILKYLIIMHINYLNNIAVFSLQINIPTLIFKWDIVLRNIRGEIR